MIAHELGTPTRAELIRLVRALGRHRYVAGCLHQIHAFVFEAIGPLPGLEDAHAWALRTLANPELDPGSRDERLQRRASDDELVCALEAIWTDPVARDRLRGRLGRIDAVTSAFLFDELAEDSTFPVLVDAGWELLPLAALDPEKHAGVIRALDAQEGEADFEVARFEEENAIPREATLYELPLLGALELLEAFESEQADAEARAVLPIWASGHPVYLDYVLRGVAKVAKLR